MKTPSGVNLQNASVQSNSLMFHAVAGLLVMLALMSVAIFFGIDGFVSQQFSRLHRDQVANQNRQVTQQIQNELGTYEALVKLIAADSDLRQSAQYRMYLEGEVAPLKQDVQRIAGAFRLEWLSVSDDAGKLIAASNDQLAGITDDMPAERQGHHEASAALAWIDESLWVVAQAPLMIGEGVAGWVQIGRQTGIRGSPAGALEERLKLYPVTQQNKRLQPPSSVRIPVWSPSGKVVALDIVVADPAHEALAQTKRIIALILLISAVLAAIVMVYYLRRLLLPVRQLTMAVGELPDRLKKDQLASLEIGGQGEVRQLVNAFNDMIQHLQRIRELEAEVHRQEKLSAIGQVAMRVAHDLNNPMTVIKNTAYLLKPELGSRADLLEDVDRIIHYCSRCSSTVNNLLRFGKPAKLKFEPIDLDACMQAYCRELGERYAGSRIKVVVQPGGPYRTMGDRHQLEQMVDNLIDNAIEANGNKEIEIVIGAENDGRYFMRFTDFGKGFRDVEADKAFDLFFTTKQTGTGLGLSNARAIALAHGGDIAITDPEHGGVTVWLKASH